MKTVHNLKNKMKRTFFLIAKIMASPTRITGELDQNIMNQNRTMRTIDEAGLPPLDVLLTEDDRFDGIENINKMHSSSQVNDEIENETLSLYTTDENDTIFTNNVIEMVDESGLPPSEVLLEVTESKFDFEKYREDGILTINLTVEESGIPPFHETLKDNDEFAGINDTEKIYSSAFLPEEIIAAEKVDNSSENLIKGILDQDIDFTTESSLLTETTTFFEEDTCLIWYPDGVFEKLPNDLCTPKNTTVSVETVETTDYCGKWPWGTQWLCLLIF